MRKIKMVLAASVLAIVGAFSAITPNVFADNSSNSNSNKSSSTNHNCPPDSARKTWDNTIAECSITEEHKDDNLFNTIQDVINFILAILGIITVIVIILGGINYITSQGDPGKTKKARDTILYGVIGLVVALLAYAIVNFILANIFGANNNNSSSSSSDKKAVTTTIVQKKE